MILVRSYLREIALNLILVFGGVTLLVVLGAAVQASSRSQGAPLWIPALLIPLLVGNVVPYLVPVTLLVAVLLTYGRMAADGEQQAVLTAGIHPLRLLLPALLAGAAVTAATYPVSAALLPRLYTTMRGLSYRLRFSALENTNPGASELHFQGLHMLWKERDRNGDFRDVILFHRQDPDFKAFAFDPGPAGTTSPAPDAGSAPATLRVRAEKVRMSLSGRTLLLVFEGMRSFGSSDSEHAWSYRSPGATYLRFDLNSLGTRSTQEHKPDDFTSAELRVRLAELHAAAAPPATSALSPEQREREAARAEKAGVELERARFTLWRRCSVAVAAIPLALVGALLGWRVRRAGVLPAFAAGAGVVLLVFYPLFYLGRGLNQAGAWDALPAAWLPVAGLLLVIGVLGLLPRKT
ncbi:MAG: LptF/LptG family permease [Planctomycetota bacterium]|nr:MAG: LptF/LptG family permease [Planctomycetota bacterium]